jgi:putative hemolysin
MDISSLEFSTFYLTSLVAIFVLLAISAMISASEVAFFSLKADDLDRCRDEGDRPSLNILDLLSRPRLLLATILIANNFVNVGIVTISTFLLWDFAGTRKPEETLVAIVTIVTTIAITFFGEIVPKVYATKRNMIIARATGAAWLLAAKVFRPLSYVLMGMGSVIERRIAKRGYNSTLEELNQALELTTDNPETSVDEREILRGIVNFGTLTVKQVMKSRLEISTADVEWDYAELLEAVKKSGYSRIPVFRGTIDHIEGILYTKDLLPYLTEGKNFQWQRLLRPGFFVPETKRLDGLLRDFKNKHVHIAIVADEYGGTSGLVTLEDLIEEIIGEINDEFDEVSTQYQKVDDKTFIFEGKTSLHDFCKVLDVEPQTFDEVRGESESLGGLLLELNKTMPLTGETLTFDRFTFDVLTVDEKRIKRIRVHVGNDLAQA